jgi:hypothetical protein
MELDLYADMKNDDAVLTPQLVAAFNTRREEHEGWVPRSREEVLAHMFVEERGREESVEKFRVWLTNEDRMNRLWLLQHKPGDYPPDEVILVRPSTGLQRSFHSVLEAKKVLDQVLALTAVPEGELTDANVARVSALMHILRIFLGLD